MLKSMQRILLSVGLCAGITTAVRADDLNVGAAKDRYQAQQQLADQAASAYQTEQGIYNDLVARSQAAQSKVADATWQRNQARADLASIDQNISANQADQVALESKLQSRQTTLNSAESTLRSAKDDLERARREKERAERDLEDLRRQIEQVRNGPRSGDWTCTYNDAGFEEHRGGHSATSPTRGDADAKAKAICLKLHGSCNLQDCEQPEPPQLRDLEAREPRLEDERQRREQRVNQAASTVEDDQSQVTNLQQGIANDNVDLSKLQADNDALRRDRDRQVTTVSDAQSSLSAAQQQDAEAQRVADNELPNLNAAKARAAREATLAQSLSDYYQTVLANYNRALAKVYAAADAAATTDGGKEAQDRAPAPASKDGAVAGSELGTTMGTNEGTARDRYQGYVAGRSTAGSDANLALAYGQGKTQGAQLALKKAQAEDQPRGYNDALSSLLATTPAAVATTDIATQVPTDPGQNGETVPSTAAPVGTQPVPAYPLPAAPVILPPSFTPPSVSAPAPDRRYSKAPCDSLVLPEFTPLCRDRYAQSYQEAFADQYESIYTTSFQTAFDPSARDAFSSALSVDYKDARSAGVAQGATDQGVLDGFAASLDAARVAAYKQGQDDLAKKLTGGHLLVVRSIDLIGTDGDGVISGAENARLRIVIDNLGAQASPLAKLQLKVTSTTGVAKVSFMTRDLPALAANTRTTLLGATLLQPASLVAGAALSVSGEIDVQSGGLSQGIQSFTSNAAVHFPLELTDVKLAGPATVNQDVKATLTLKNLSNAAIPLATINTVFSPNIVTISSGNAAKLTAVNPGETRTVDLNIKPGVWVGGNSAVNLVSSPSKDGTTPWFTQNYPMVIPVLRDAEVLLFDLANRPLPAGKIKVTAGSVFSFTARFNYLAKTALPGPFVLSSRKTSSPDLSTTVGSMVSIDYGSREPGIQEDPVEFSFNIPASLKGQSAWVMVELSEGGAAIHAPVVYLDVQ